MFLNAYKFHTQQHVCHVLNIMYCMYCNILSLVQGDVMYNRTQYRFFCVTHTVLLVLS